MNVHLKEIMYLLFVRMPMTLKGRIKKNLVRMHWGRGLHNFGDCMQPYIAKHYGMTPVYATSQKKSDIVLEGTIMSSIPEDYRGIIAGTGSDKGEYSFPEADVAAVRGQLTRSNVKTAVDPLILGDPGLLMPKIFPCRKTSEYKLGIIPHFVDKKDPRIESFIKNNHEISILLIDVFSSPEKVCKEVNRCQYIFSSSLHGLIIADAYDIPNFRFSIASNRKQYSQEFYDYKFCDYYSSFKEEKINNHEWVELIGDEKFDDLEHRFFSNHKEVIPLINRLNTVLAHSFSKIKRSQIR